MRTTLLAGVLLSLSALTTGCAERAYMEPREPIASPYAYGEYEREPYYRAPGYRPYGPFIGETEIGD